MDPLNPAGKPKFKPVSLPATWQKQDSESNLANDDRIHGDLALVPPKPFHDFRIWSWLCGFAQNVSVDEEGQSSSVDSESIGTKKPLLGQLRSHSTMPSFGGGF